MKKNIIILVIGILLVICAGIFCYVVFNSENTGKNEESLSENLTQEDQELLNEIEASVVLDEESKTKDIEDVEYTDFSVQTKDGKTVKLSDFKDQAVIVMFYSEENSDSMSDLEKLVDLYDKYKNKVEFMVIKDDEDIENTSYPFEVYLDKDNKAKNAFNITEYPSLIYITKENEILNAKSGFTTSDALEANLDLLSENF